MKNSKESTIKSTSLFSSSTLWATSSNIVYLRFFDSEVANKPIERIKCIELNLVRKRVQFFLSRRLNYYQEKLLLRALGKRLTVA